MQMEQFTIRRAVPRDIAAIADFNQAMALETEGKTLIPSVISAGVRSLIEDPAKGFYIVAEVDSMPVASLLITMEWSDWRNGMFWWIQSVYILPEYRRQGIYRRMYEFIKDDAKRSPSVCGFRLYVERDNANAQSTYAALGMTETHYKFFEELTRAGDYLESD